jgi:hypothetical protein
MSLKRKVGEAYMIYKIRAGRGSVFTAEIEGLQNAFQKGGIIILLIDAYFHWLPPLWILPILWAVQKGFEYFMGWYDEKHLGWWRFSSEYEQRNINPWNQEVLQILKKLDENQRDKTIR